MQDDRGISVNDYTEMTGKVSIENETTTTEPVEPQEPAGGAPAAVEAAEQGRSQRLRDGEVVSPLAQQPEADAAPAAEPAGDEPLGEAGAKALQAERERRREVERELREQREQVQALKLAAARRDVAQSHRLSEAQAELLVGETADEMAAHADRLLNAFATPEPPAVRRRPVEVLRSGVLGIEGAPPSTDQIADRVLAG